MKEIILSERVTAFAEDKDTAREIRISQIEPALQKKQDIIIDFNGIDGVTQSFIHALISETLRNHGNDVLDSISFRNCNETVQKIISIVIEYMQESQ